MGNFSRNTFDKSKHYAGVRLQQGVPLVDADWNEMEDIRRNEIENALRWFIGDGVPKGNDGFGILPIGVGNDFLINGSDGSTDGAGRCLVQGWEVLNEEPALHYTDQQLFKDPDLAARWKVDKLQDLNTPLSSNRTDLVYLDVWEREVDSQEDDTLINPSIGVPTCVRMKREWVVRVAEDSSDFPVAPAGHAYYCLAILARRVGCAVLESDDIIDLRLTGVNLAMATGTTGVLSFPPLAPETLSYVSDWIDPGLGSGAISVQLGLDRGTKEIINGDAAVFQIMGNDSPKVSFGALIDSQTGMFKIGIQLENASEEGTQIRWWARMSGQDRGQMSVPVGAVVHIDPNEADVKVNGSVDFNVRVYGTSNKTVTWYVCDIMGGNEQVGTITDSGQYKAPSNLPTENIVTVRCRSVEDPQVSDTASVKITPAVGGITGAVKNEVGQAIEGVLVKVQQDKFDQTDVNGEYALNDLLPGQYTVWAIPPPAYVGNKKDVTVKPNETVVADDFILPKATAMGSINGVVVTRLANRHIPLSEADVRAGNKSGKTDSRGIYSLRNLPVGPCMVTAHKVGYSKGQQEVIVKEKQIIEAEAIWLEKVACICGRVAAKNRFSTFGKPISGAKIEISGHEPAVTKDNGSYLLVDLPIGVPCKVTVRAKGYRVVAKEVVPGIEPLKVDFLLEEGRSGFFAR